MDSLASRNLIAAAQSGDCALLEQSIAAGADVHAADPETGQSALLFAAQADEPVIAALLVRRDPQTQFATNKRGNGLAHIAAAANSLRVLRDVLDGSLCSGVAAHISARNLWRETPLHLAVSAGHREAVALLVAAGAAMDAGDQWHRTPIDIACEVGGALLDCFGEAARGRAALVSRQAPAEDAGASSSLAAVRDDFLAALRDRQAGAAAVRVRHLFGESTDAVTLAPPLAPPVPPPCVSAPERQQAPKRVRATAALPYRAAGGAADASAVVADARATPPCVRPTAVARDASKRSLSRLVEFPGDAVAVARLLGAGDVDVAGLDYYGLPALHKVRMHVRGRGSGVLWADRGSARTVCGVGQGGPGRPRPGGAGRARDQRDRWGAGCKRAAFGC